MSENVIIAYKNLGETPLKCLEEARISHGIGVGVPMTYAGRLDPMAEGLMIILVGDECKNKDKYLGLDKVYEFQILVGFSTDTYDLLGVVVAEPEFIYSGSASALQEVLYEFTGTFIQKYPAFSSKTINGKQLFQLAKDDELPNELPEHKVTISKLEFIRSEQIPKEELKEEILRRISLVEGDFRQDEIIKKWQEVLRGTNQKEYEIISLICECSSGTYIRQLVSDISEKIKVPLVTYMINRTKIGDYINI